MDIGMLWFDNDKDTDLNAKVNRAVNYYQNKYGVKPNICFVNPSMFPEVEKTQVGRQSPRNNTKNIAGVEVRESSTMLPNHFWLGINRQEK